MRKTVHESKLKITGDNKSALNSLKGVSRGLGNAQRDLKGFNSGIAGSFGSISSMFTSLPFLASAAAVGVVTGLGRMISSTIDTAEHIEKMSQRIGVSAEDLSTLTYAAQLAGTEIGVFEKAIQRASRNIDDASRGIGDGKVAFDELGITVVEANGNLRAADEVMEDISDRFEQMPDGTKKTALALKIFGRAGADLIPLLNGGSAGLKRMKQEARDLGLEISTKTARDAAEFKDDMLRLKSTFTGIATEITSVALPSLNKFSNWMLDDAIPALKGTVNWIDESEVSIRNFSNSWTDYFNQSIKNDLNYVGDKLNKVGIGKYFDIQVVKSKEAGWGIKRLADDYSNLYKLNDTLYGKKSFSILDSFKNIADKSTTGVVELTKEQIKAAEALEKQWNNVSTSLNSEMVTAGLTGVHLQFVKIDQKVESLYEKFGEKDLIGDWAETMKLALIDASSIPIELAPSYKEPEIAPTGLVDFDTSFYDKQKEQIAEVSNWEMANYAMRTGAAETMFSNMSQASHTFFELGKKQNKAAFLMYKAFGMSEAAISTYKAATAALEPPPIGLGPVWGIPLAVSTVGLGLANVGRIASMSPGSTGGGGMGGYSVPSLPSGSNYDNSNSNNSQQINITIESGWQDPDELVRTIIPALEKYTDYGGSININ